MLTLSKHCRLFAASIATSRYLAMKMRSTELIVEISEATHRANIHGSLLCAAARAADNFAWLILVFGACLACVTQETRLYQMDVNDLVLDVSSGWIHVVTS